ncbi:MAG: hypothetical protein JRJ37_03945 [Deltaproteobacteria bacterium]|nr:hypothetical protein [Deltaproteobacteria bacterium]
MKRILILMILLLAAAAFAAKAPSANKKFRPTEKIPADTAVSFPVDI